MASAGGLMVMPSVAVAVAPAASLAWTVKVKAPAAEGIPLIDPPVASVSPAGSVPETTDHEYPPAPPVAARVWEKAVPTVPLGSELVVMASAGGLMVMPSALVAVAPAASL